MNATIRLAVVAMLSTAALIGGNACGGSHAASGAAVENSNVDARCPVTTATTSGPTALASGQDLPGGIAVDATNVYWVNYGSGSAGPVQGPVLDGQVMKCAKAGCGRNPTALASGLAHPTSIAVDATSVYWTDVNGALMKVRSGGGTPTTLATAQSAAALAVDASNVYWANGDGTVMKVPTDGGNPTALASGQNNPAGIAVDAHSVYWSNYGDGTVMKVPIEGGTPTTLASGQSSPLAIAIDSTNVYFTNDHGGSVVKVPIGDRGSQTKLASVTIPLPNTQPTGIAVDGTNVYWTDGRGNELQKVSVGGGAPTTLGSGQSFLNGNGVAVDCASVYWTDVGGTVTKLPLGSAAR